MAMDPYYTCQCTKEIFDQLAETLPVKHHACMKQLESFQPTLATGSTVDVLQQHHTKE